MKRFVAFLSLMLVGVVAHGLLPFTDHVLWDGFWYHSQLALNEPGGMVRLFHEIGRPLDFWFVKLADLAPGPAPAKWLSFLCWILVPPLMEIVLRRGVGLPGILSWSVCAVAAAAPCFDVLGEISVWPNVFAVLLFWCGWALGVSRNNFLSRAAAALLFLASFNLNSQLVFFYAVAVWIFMVRLESGGIQSPRDLAWRIVSRRGELVLLPILFWIVKSFLTPQSGAYANYNKPSFFPERLVEGFGGLQRDFLGGMFAEIAELPPAVFGLAAGFLAFGLLLALRGHIHSDFQALWLVPAGGFFLMAAAAFPYFVVDQPLSSSGWWSRNTILMPLPIGLILAGGAAWLNKMLLPRNPGIWFGPVLAVLMVFCAASNANYLRLQALGAKQEAVSKRLAWEIARTGAVVVQVRDDMPVPGTIAFYPPLIWTHLAAGISGQPKAFVMEIGTMVPPKNDEPVFFNVDSGFLEERIAETTVPYMLAHLPRTGPQILVEIEPRTPIENPAALGAQYLAVKWFDPERRDRMVADLARFSVVDLPPVDAKTEN
jgi:hypothetical protein